MRAPTYPKCSQAMKEGFILDHTRNGRLPSEWVEGPPQHSFWTGLRLRGKERHKVATFRCPKCGYLESYAMEA
ncbi:hypothetical protein [Tautonia plasticadhaerens]|uniref:Uncharacterized protein n=1 Tax=Tautonia plasticadhaerens TaxID=2527974 RepID=A0A518H677_9BACT|nr:hypothetical protein [Tautonia plasticadhaerens]QDV36344.1 hypothetical protein ElP_42640 [Tautonia plasticadhaerens]